MALQNGNNQNENSEPTKIEEVTGITDATDLTNVKQSTLESDANIFNSPIDPPKKTTGTPMTEEEAAARRAANKIDNTKPNIITTDLPLATEAKGFLDSMAQHAPTDTSIMKPIDQSINFDDYKDYLSSNSFYFDSNSDLDKTRAINQSNWVQARNAVGRTLLNVVPEAIKQTANAFDFEDWSKADAETGNWISDAMTSIQSSVKESMPIYRENPGVSLDVSDPAYWAETGESLITSIGGFALSGYALAGGLNLASKGVNSIGLLGATITDSIRGTTAFQEALAASKASGIGSNVRSLSLNYLMNRSESIGIAAQTYATVYEREYNNSILKGKTPEESRIIAKQFAAEGASGTMKFNAINMLLNTTSSNLFLKSANIPNLVKKEGLKVALIESGKEGVEEYINDLGQLYGEGMNSNNPLTFKKAVNRLGTAEGIESPILGFIGGAGQQSLTKAGKYIETSDNSSYARNFNKYLLEHPITATNKEESIQKAIDYAYTESNKDNKKGFMTNISNAGGQKTSTAQQLDSLYVAQQAALVDYKKAGVASNMNDVVNMSISSEFSVNLMNYLNSDPTITPEQKDILLERSLLSAQAYSAMNVGTMEGLKNLYSTYANMDETEAKERGLLTNEVEGEDNHYKTKAKKALKTLDAYEMNYRASENYINSAEVYNNLNEIYFNNRNIIESSENYNTKAKELDDISRALFEQDKDKSGLEFYEKQLSENKIAVHPSLKGSKIEEEISDLRKAVEQAKINKNKSVVNLNTITSSEYIKNLTDLVKLYKNKQIADKAKVESTNKFADNFKNLFTGKNKINETINNRNTNTTDTSTTGESQPDLTNITNEILNQAREANNPNNNINEENKPTQNDINNTDTIITNQSDLSNEIVNETKIENVPNNTGISPTIFTYDLSDIKASTTMQAFIDGDQKAITRILTSNASIDTKISKLEENLNNKIQYDREGAKVISPSDGLEVVDQLISKLQTKINELKEQRINLSPDIQEAIESYESTITDFGLGLEEERLLQPIETDDEGNPIEPTKAVVDSKYNIYSSILDQMKARGINTSNFSDVMDDFKTILGDRLTQSEFNSLQGLYNFTNNTNHNSNYQELFGSTYELNNELDNANRLAKVTLPSGRFIYDLDIESQMVLQGERQAIILDNPDSEVKGLAFPIYNEEGANKIAYLAQQYSTVRSEQINSDGETYTLVDKVTTTGLLNVDLDSKTLEPDFFKIGDNITFIPLDSFTDEDGNVILASDLPVSEKPIGLVINGELVQGLYLHTASWINATNINNTAEFIENDRNNLITLRNKIFNGEQINTKITEISTGAPIKNPNNSQRTFASEFPTHPVGIIRNGELETVSGNIQIPEYMSFPEGATVIKVGDYFHYGSRTGLFLPMRKAILTSIRAFATGEHSDGTKFLNQNQGLDVTTSKGLEGYLKQLVNISPIKIGESYPIDLATFTVALNTREENEVYINFIKGDLYIGRGQGLDITRISPKGYINDIQSLDIILNSLEGLLQDSYANVDLGSLKANEGITIINDEGEARKFDTYEDYVKQVTTSQYGSIDLLNGTNITTIQKRISFDLPSIDAKSNPKKEKQTSKTEVITTPTGEQTVINFTGTDNIIDDITDDFSPDIINPNVEYSLKAVNILNTDKAKSIFEKGNKNNWSLNKILSELQIPKEQKQIILDSGNTNINDIITDLLSNYTYTIEINRGIKNEDSYHTYDELNDYISNVAHYEKTLITEEEKEKFKGDLEFPKGNYSVYADKDGRPIAYFDTEEEAQKAVDKLNKNVPKIPTEIYKDLTVPGGSNYTENEIATPLITPSIKGHAEFATDNGIGWFRSDEVTNNTNTRRILEVQSDLFQKGRNSTGLVTNTEGRGEFIGSDENENYFSDETGTDNKFLQLLNKDNNWVNFFIKSIVQDSSKKGYNKVLFPLGNTANKVEGQTTLEEFKKEKENRLKYLENTQVKYFAEELSSDWEPIGNRTESFNTKEEAEIKGKKDYLNYQISETDGFDNTIEIKQLKQELQRLEIEGSATFLPIHNFYETTITNTLNKIYGKDNIKQITDEYGNTWNELTIANVSSTVDLQPTVEDPLISPSLIPGLSNKLQQIIIQDIVLDYYGLLIDATKSKNKVSKLEDFYDAKVSEYDKVLIQLEQQNYSGINKVKQQVEIIKANKTKILAIARQNLTRQLGVKINEGNLEIESTNNSTASNDEDIDAPDGIEVDEATERSRIYDANEFGIDPKLSMSNSIRHMLYGIVDAQLGFNEELIREVIDGVEIERVVRTMAIKSRKVPLQVPVYVNANEVYEDLIKLFTKSSTNNGMNTTEYAFDPNSNLHPKIQVAIGVLKSKYTVKPYYTNVVEKLEQMDMETQLNFIRAFNKNVTDHIKVIEYLSKDGKSLSLRSIKNSTQNGVNNLKQVWSINLKAISGYTPGDEYMTLNPAIYNAFTTAYNQIKGNKDLQTYPAFKQLFSLLGINLTNAAFEKLRAGVFVDGKPKTLDQQFEHIQGYFNRIKKRVDTIMHGGPKGSPLDVNLLYQDKVFTEFANFLLDFDKSVFNNSYTNGNGDTIYGVTNNRYFMERFISLKNNVQLLRDLKQNNFSSKSIWLNNLLNNATGSINKGDFYNDFSYHTLDSYVVRDTNKAKMVDTLTRKELVKMSLSLFMNQGRSRLNNTVPVHKYIIPALSDKTNMFVVEAQGRFYSLVNNRLLANDLNFLRSQLFEGEFLRIVQAEARGNIGDKAYDQGSKKFLMFPLFNEIEGLYIDGKINSAALTDKDIMADVDEVIMDYVIDGMNKTKSDWINLKLGKEGKDGLYTDKMTFIDSKYADFAKNHVKQSMEEMSSLALNYHVNYLVANANMQQVIFNDPAFYYKRASNSKTDIENTFDNVTKRYAAVNGGKDEFQFPAGSKFDVLSINDTNLKSNSLEYLSALWAGHPDHDAHMAEYSSMEAGDAQEYTSLEEHLDRMVYGNMLSRDIAKDVLKKYKETGKVSKSDLTKILIPFKPLYFNTFMSADGVIKTLYIKTSSLPLIKELTKGTQLDLLREYLDNPKTKPKVAVFASGIKAGNPTTSLNLFDTDGNIIPEALKGNLDAHIISNIPREGHGNQQANPDKSLKQVINDGTQQAKLLFTNILDITGFKNPFNEGTLNGRELSTMYLNRYEDRFKKQYDKLMKELKVDQWGNINNIGKLQKILTEEALGRGWTFNEASSFELDSTGLNFKIPLWMSISSTKIESLLSSIVDNRIRKRKRFGRAYILASDAGVRTFDKSIDNINSGIIFTDDFTGELRNSRDEDGNITSAEILVPFRFFDNSGNLLKITDFITDDKLDTNKLPSELLEGFGYRIPTSGINLMNNIKVVGFLPDSYGDAVIAPADFTKQMGSDFDVDKFYTNTYATYYNKSTGVLEKLSQNHISKKDEIANNIDKVLKEINLLRKYKGSKKDDLIKIAREDIKNLRNNDLYRIKDLDILVLDNEITDIQRAVLNNPDKTVQRARTKPLSFGRLPEMVDKFGTKVNDMYYSFLNRDVQDINYLNGNLGKTAVGNFSLDMILNSLGQYIKTPLYFQNKVKRGDDEYYVRTDIKAFGFTGNNINDALLNDGSGRFKSDVLEGLMAAALDNGKEQILGKLGITDSTFDFIRAMVATGFNEEVVMGVLAQPIVKIYLDSGTSYNVKARIEQAVNNIKNKTTFLADTNITSLTEALDDYETYTSNLDEFSKAVAISGNGNTQTNFSLTNQIGVMAMFLAMEKKGQALSQVRSALNVDSAGVGKNIIYSNAKLEQEQAALENPSINNVNGYFISMKTDGEGKAIKNYVSIGRSAMHYGAQTNADLWGKFFPFSNETMQKIVKTIAKRTGKDIFRLNSYSDYATLIMKDFKSFLSASVLPDALPSFMKTMSTTDIHKSIIHSTPNHQSLGEFILDLRDNTTSTIKYTNDLLAGLDIDTIDHLLSSEANPQIVNISYSNNSRVDNNENDIVNSIIEMINEPVDLGTWNGNPINSRDLANLLITHQLISKGVPGAGKFIQFIPTKQLERLGYYDRMSEQYRAIQGLNVMSNTPITAPQFLMQHLQHNMADYYESGKENTYRDYFVNGVYTGKGISHENMPTFIVFKDGDSYYAQHKTNIGFTRLNPLGWRGNTEYNHRVFNPISINPDNNRSMVNVKVMPIPNNVKEVTDDVVSKTVGNIIIDSTLGKQTTIDVIVDYNVDTEENITKELKAYPITMTANGSTVDFFLVKNDNTYNTIYHPVTGFNIPIEGLSATTTKTERDVKIMEALSSLNLNQLEGLGLAEEVETINIEAIEANIQEFMTPSRDKSEDVFPDDINTTTREFADELGLSDTTLNLEDKYRLIFNRISDTMNIKNKVLSYFLRRAGEIIPLLSTTPIVMDTTLQAKGMYNSQGYIVINPNKFTTIEDMASVIAHEAIHGLFKRQVKVKNPIVKDLERFRKEVEEELAKEFGQEAIDNMKAKMSNRQSLSNGIESDLLYPILNVDELITGVLTNPAFQTYLNSKDMKLANKSLWTKVLELMSSMLRLLGVRENSKLEDSLGAIFALTNDIRDNHLSNIPNPTYQRSLDFINGRFNLLSNTNTLLPKGNAQQIADFINNNFANTTATVVEDKYVEIAPTVFLSPNTTSGNLSPDDWDLEFINGEMNETAASTNEVKGNYYQYAASLRARVLQGEKVLNKAKISGDVNAIEQATNTLLQDKINLINLRKIQSLGDFAMRAQEDLDKVNAVLNKPMNSEDITYSRNLLNFWKDVREYTFTSKHRESENLMRKFGMIEDDAQTAIKKLELIEKKYLEDFIQETLGKTLSLDDVFSDYKDINSIVANVRDISTYDNDLLTAIWKKVQIANIEAETESEILLKNLNDIIDKVMPKLKAINSKSPYEIFRQLSENGLKTNHLINAYSSKFYSDRSRAYTLAKNGQTAATVNNYANWIKTETKALNLNKYFPSNGIETEEVLANRGELRKEVGDFAYNMWFNGQRKKLNSYNKRKEAIMATIKDSEGMDLDSDINSNPKALAAIQNWAKKHSPYEFNKVVNSKSYKYEDGLEGVDGFSTYEVLPNKTEHYNKDFETIANDADLMKFYNEFSDIYESLKQHVPASQFANLIYGGLPVLDQSIYEVYSKNGLKGLYKGIKTAWANSITSTISKGQGELDLVTGENRKDMFIPGITSQANAISSYVNIKSIEYEVRTGNLPSQALITKFREQAIDSLSNKGDFDLGKLMKVFGTLVISHKQIASVEDLIKIGQYTLNSYKEQQVNPDGTVTTRAVGGNATLPAANSFLNTKKALTYFINSQVYGNIKDNEMVFERKKFTAEEEDLKKQLDMSKAELDAKLEAGTITQEFYDSLKRSIDSNVDRLGKNVVGSKIGDNWLKYVQLKLMGWNILGGLSNSIFGFVGNMIEAAGEGSFNLQEMNEAYRMTMSSVAKNLTFDKLQLGDSAKIRNAMQGMNVMKEASHELYTSNESTSFGGKFKFASPYNMNQRTEYLNQAPIMIILAKKTMVDTKAGRISIWEGMNDKWEWNTEKYGPKPTNAIMDMRININKQIQRIHGNYDPASPLMIKKTLAGRAVSQFRTWLYESVAVRFEAERFEHAIGTTVKGRYRTLGGLIFENEGRIDGMEFTREFSKALLNNFTFGVAKLKSFQNSNLSDIDSQNLRKVAMELVLLLDAYLLIALLRAGLSDDDDESKALYNVLLNQGTRLKSDLLLYVNPSEARNIFKDIVPSMSLYDDIYGFMRTMTSLEDDEVKTGVHKGDSKRATATMKVLPGSSKIYSTYNAASQIFDKDIKINDKEDAE